MKKYYFNWNELKIAAENNFSGILILTYALTIGYNKLIAKSNRLLFNILNINEIPNSLFRKNYLWFNKESNIFGKFKCNEPQAYFINSNFLRSWQSPEDKVNYLFMLSNRVLNSKEPSIPFDYIEENLYTNPFIKIENKKLFFKPELLLTNIVRTPQENK